MAARRSSASMPEAETAAGRASEESEEVASHIAAIAKLIGTRDEGLAAFFQSFIRNAPAEDVIRYRPGELAALIRLVFARYQKRKPGKSLVQAFAPAGEDRAFQHRETIVLAVNDDMPFLFDFLHWRSGGTGPAHSRGVSSGGFSGGQPARQRDRAGVRSYRG